MRSTLKKSLYLGLAALSFASVAGVANNANAAKHHKATKTYAKASYKNIPNQGNSNVAYNVTGSNALFNKPGTVKGAKTVASKATMSDLASAKENFMVYQTAVTNRGSKYIKVVSFNKQYRGWIYAGNNNSASYGTGVNQVNLSTQAAPQYSSVYLSNPGQTALKSTPEGAQFNASSDNFAHTGFVYKDAFSVDAAQTVSKTGTTWYHLVDQNDNTINGWVPSNQVQLSSTNNYFNNRTQVKVNYTNNGQVVKSTNVDVSALPKKSGYSNVLDSNSTNGLASAINNVSNNNDSNSVLYNSGYKLGNSLTGNESQLQYVEAGDTVNVPVNSTNTNGSVVSKMNFHVLNGVSGASDLSTSSFNVPSVNSDQLSTQLNGFNSREYINMNRVLGTTNSGNDNFGSSNIYGSGNIYNNNTKFDYGNDNIFANQTSTTNPTKLGVLFGGTQYATSTINNAASNDNDVMSNGENVSRGSTINQGNSFHYDYVLNRSVTANNNNGKTYGQNVDLYYDIVPVANSASNNTSNSTNNYF